MAITEHVAARLRFVKRFRKAGQCGGCKVTISAGSAGWWDPVSGSVACVGCCGVPSTSRPQREDERTPQGVVRTHLVRAMAELDKGRPWPAVAEHVRAALSVLDGAQAADEGPSDQLPLL